MPELMKSRLNATLDELEAEQKAFEQEEVELNKDPDDDDEDTQPLPSPDDEPTQPGVNKADEEDDEEEVDELFQPKEEVKEEQPKSTVELKDEDKVALASAVKQEILTSLGVTSIDELQTTLAFVKQLAQKQIQTTLVDTIASYGVIPDEAPNVLNEVMNYWSSLPAETIKAIAEKEASTGLSPIQQILRVLRKSGKLSRDVFVSSGKTMKTKPLGSTSRSTKSVLSDDDLLKLSDAEYEELSDSFFN